MSYFKKVAYIFHGQPQYRIFEKRKLFWFVTSCVQIGSSVFEYEDAERIIKELNGNNKEWEGEL